MNGIKGIDELKDDKEISERALEKLEDEALLADVFGEVSPKETEKAPILEAVDLVAAITSVPEGARQALHSIAPIVRDKIRFEDGDIGLEAMADEVHQVWCMWMEHLFKQGWPLMDEGFKINRKFVKRWKRQMTTPYVQLSEEEKQSERGIARRYLNVAYALENETEENHV